MRNCEHTTVAFVENSICFEKSNLMFGCQEADFSHNPILAKERPGNSGTEY